MTAPACESCGAAVPAPKHGAGIGGGWADLCQHCASMLCACGARVLANDAFPLVDGTDVHRWERCEADGLTFSRPGGCPCDACNPDRQGERGAK